MRRIAASVGLLLTLIAVAAIGLGAAGPGPQGSPPPKAKHTASIQLLTISDWHGQIDPTHREHAAQDDGE